MNEMREERKKCQKLEEISHKVQRETFILDYKRLLDILQVYTKSALLLCCAIYLPDKV